MENAIDVTGSVKSIIRSCKAMQDEFNFIFLLPSNSKASFYVKSNGFIHYEMPMRELRRTVPAILLYIPALLINSIRLNLLLKKLKIDLIHSNDFYNLIPCVYKIFWGKLPYICHVRFMPTYFPKFLVLILCYLHKKYAASVIVVSHAVKRELIYVPKVEVIPDGLPSEETEYVPPTVEKIFYPANFTRGKGQECALQSFAVIAKKYPDWTLRFIGSDLGLRKNVEYRKELIRLAVDLGIDNRIEWGGFSNDMPLEYERSSIVLNFSESESFSLTCQEALYYGRPVIATDSGGPAEIIDHRVSGMIVKKGDVMAMSMSMDTLMSDRALRVGMGFKGWAIMRERFSRERTVGLLQNQYFTVLARHKNS